MQSKQKFKDIFRELESHGRHAGAVGGGGGGLEAVSLPLFASNV